MVKKKRVSNNKTYLIIFIILVIFIVLVYAGTRIFGSSERINKNIPPWMLYTSGEIPEQYLLVGTQEGYVGGVVDNELILADPIAKKFYCKILIDSGLIIQDGQKVEYYSYSPGWGKSGGWSFRYAVICGDNYFIVDGSDPIGIKMYGPFNED